MSIRRNGVLVTGPAASLEPCGRCGCPRWMHTNGRGACYRDHHPDHPKRSTDYTATVSECPRWMKPPAAP